MMENKTIEQAKAEIDRLQIVCKELKEKLESAEKELRGAVHNLRLARHDADKGMPKCELWHRSRWSSVGQGYAERTMVIIKQTPTGMLKIRAVGDQDGEVLTAKNINGTWRIPIYKNRDGRYWLEGVPPEFDPV